MLHEYRDIIATLRADNGHFAKMFDKHNALDHKISDVTSGREYMDSTELECLKKEKLLLKDKIYAMCVEYQKENA